MPAKEIKELRQAGKLGEALSMALAELESSKSGWNFVEGISEEEKQKAYNSDLSCLWAKRNISWVYYDYLKQNNTPENIDEFIAWLGKIKELQLPEDEKMLYDHLSWLIGALVFKTFNSGAANYEKMILLLEIAQSFAYTKPSEGYSFLFKAFHKALKDTDRYIQFADWWNFANFRNEDYQKEKLPNGKEIMSVTEQAYIAYSKHLLPKQTQYGEVIFNREKAEAFLPVLTQIVEDYPQFQYPAYFTAKLLLALGDKDNMLESLLPFAKKKRNDFWVWQILSESFSNDDEKVFACYCKALLCKSPEEMLVGLRQKMARVLISKQLYNEARTEIELLVKARNEHEFKIPNEVVNWQTQDWYKEAACLKSNIDLYKQYSPIAEAILFGDVKEETVIVEFVNSDKKILNFIASENKFGFFKYERFFRYVNIGDTLKVRFQGGSNEGMHQVYTAFKVNDDEFKGRFMRSVSGVIKMPAGKTFGFIEDIYVHPALMTKLKLKDGEEFNGKAIKSYNQEKKQWGWKLI